MMNVHTAGSVNMYRYSAPVHTGAITPVNPVKPIEAVQDKQNVRLFAGRSQNEDVKPGVQLDSGAVEMSVRQRMNHIDPQEIADLTRAEKTQDGEETAGMDRVDDLLKTPTDELVDELKHPKSEWEDELLKTPVDEMIEELTDPEKAEDKDSKTPAEEAEEKECQTCKNRKYKDGSNDPSVSYKTPTVISANRAAAAVRGHEMEHVSHEQAKAARDGRKVVQQSVTLHTAICPECGDIYVSGGTTRTTTKAKTNGGWPPEQMFGADRERPLDVVA